MWDMLTTTYKGMSQVKRNKLSLLTHKYELITMQESEDMKCMFGHFQTILNELKSLGRTIDNYDRIGKILRILSRKWKPQVTTFRSLKNRDTMSLEELVETLKVHEHELQQDKIIKKEKFFSLSVQKTKKVPSSKESLSRSSSKMYPKC